MKQKIIISVSIIIVILGSLGIYYCSGWSRINCWTREIDIHSGETRFRRYWFWKNVSEKISPTWLSIILDVPDKKVNRNWKMVCTLSPGRNYSPHYFYHSALAGLRLAQSTFKEFNSTEEEKRQLAGKIRNSWLETGDDQEAGRIIQNFCFAAEQKFLKKNNNQNLPQISSQGLLKKNDSVKNMKSKIH